MGAKPILAYQYFTSIFQDKFTESCINFKRQLQQLHDASCEESNKKRNTQKKPSIAKEVEECLKNSRIIEINWISKCVIGLILANGTLIQIQIDDSFHRHNFKFIIQRLPSFSNDISYAVRCKGKLLFMTQDGKIGLLTPVTLDGQLDIFPNFLPTSNSKQIDKRLSISEDGSKFAVWWTTGGDEVFPWTPKPEQRANFLVYSLANTELPSLIFYLRVDNNLLSVQFTQKGDQIITIEELSFSIHHRVGTAELKETKHNLQSGSKLSETLIPLQSQLKCHAYDTAKEKLCLGLCDSSILISFHEGRISRFTKCVSLPSQVGWHPDGMVILVLGERGQIQIFDIALNPLFFCDHGSINPPSLTMQLEPHAPFRCINWNYSTYDENTLVLLRSETGNISVLNLGLGKMKMLNLIQHHMSARPKAYSESLSVLKGVPWNWDECKYAAYAIFRNLISEKYSGAVEAFLEEFFEIYFNPVINPEERIWKSAEIGMNARALEFSKWIFEAGKLERALQIAGKVGNEGMIRKILNKAIEIGEVEIATEAQKQLESIIKKGSSSSSTINQTDSGESHPSSCSTCSSSQSSSDEIEVDIPQDRKIPKTTFSNDTTQTLTAENPSASHNKEDLWTQVGSSSGITVVKLGNV